MTPLVEVRDVSKSYRRGPETVGALHHAAFVVEEGELAALVGPSGSGKTTLLNIVAGWETPDAGAVAFRGKEQPMAELPWSEVALIPQRLGLLDELSVAENVELPHRLKGEAATADLGDLMEELGIDALAARRPSETSLGQQQRTAVARALSLKPALVLADEPAGHQDHVWGERVIGALQHATKQGSACLVATHNPETIKFCNRVFRIEDGYLRED